MKVHSFNPVANAYTEKVSPSRFSQFLALIHELKLTGAERVLDIGSGAGILSMEIASHLTNGGSLVGIDLAPNMVHLARNNAAESDFSNIAFEVGDALSLDFKDNSFDVIVSSNAFPWVPDRELFLKEVLRVLKPTGRLGLVALSDSCYKEFSETLDNISADHPNLIPQGLIPQGNSFEIMGAKLHELRELGDFVRTVGFDIRRNFTLSTVEPISAGDYLERINAIVNENYLDHIENERDRDLLKNLILQSLVKNNGDLKITESSVFVIAHKSAA